MGDPFKPKPLATPQNRSNNTFADILSSFMNGSTGKFATPTGQSPTLLPKMPGEGPMDWLNRNRTTTSPADVPGGAGAVAGPGGESDLGSWINSTFKLPGYEGDMSAGPTALQSGAVAGAKQFQDSFFAPGGTNDKIQSSLGSLLNIAPTADPLAGVDLNPTAVPSLENIRASLDPARKNTLTRDLADMQEQFGLSGLGNSTSLAESGARASSESAASLDSALAQIAPQLASIRSQNQLGIGDLVSRSRLGAGQLDLGNRELAGTAADLMGKIPMNIAAAGFNLGEGERQIGQQDLDKHYQDFLRQTSLFPQILQYLAGTPAQQYAPSTFSNLATGVSVAAPFLT